MGLQFPGFSMLVGSSGSQNVASYLQGQCGSGAGNADRFASWDEQIAGFKAAQCHLFTDF